jgi:hypothetical protein
VRGFETAGEEEATTTRDGAGMDACALLRGFTFFFNSRVFLSFDFSNRRAVSIGTW